MRLKLLLLAGLAATTALSGCTPRVKAPRDLGVCYFIGHPVGADGKKTLKFNPIGHDQPDIEHCAVLLYNARMTMLATNTAGRLTEGSYQGNFLFADNGGVSYGQTYEGPTFPLLVKDPNSERLVAPGSVVEDDTPTDTEPHTVAVPKDLPEKNAKGDVVTAPAGKNP